MMMDSSTAGISSGFLGSNIHQSNRIFGIDLVLNFEFWMIGLLVLRRIWYEWVCSITLTLESKVNSIRTDENFISR